MKHLDLELVEEKYLQLEKKIGGFTSNTEYYYKTYLQLKNTPDTECLEFIGVELMFRIEAELEEYIYKMEKG